MLSSLDPSGNQISSRPFDRNDGLISIKNIPQMANLVSLELSYCGIVEMESFYQFVNLKRLNLSSNEIKKVGDLSHLFYLESLNL